jgi:pilus assembly protein Flp/PilA
MLKLITKLQANTSGATAIEYGLIAALVSVAAIGALTALGGSLNDMFSAVSVSLDTAVSGT